MIKVCRQEGKNKFGGLNLFLLIKITFPVNYKFLILVFLLLTGLSTIFWHLSTGLSTVGVRRPSPRRPGDPPLTPPRGGGLYACRGILYGCPFCKSEKSV